jgi:hypothetical protein
MHDLAERIGDRARMTSVLRYAARIHSWTTSPASR